MWRQARLVLDKTGERHSNDRSCSGGHPSAPERQGQGDGPGRSAVHHGLTGPFPVEVPPAALKLIGQLLEAMSEGRPIVLMPTEQEFTTVEAANFLNVSRPFVIKEIEAGRLPHRKVGSHRRITLEDLLPYAQNMRAQQASALERLADNARELGRDD